MAPPPPSPTVPAATDSPPSTSSSSSAAFSSDMLNYRRIPLLVPLCKELSGSPTAQSTAAQQLLQNQIDTSATVSRFTAVTRSLNSRPVIGILSHPGDGASGRLNDAANISYIAASYVKFVESAGARVIPLIYNEPWEVLYRVSPSLWSSYVMILVLLWIWFGLLCWFLVLVFFFIFIFLKHWFTVKRELLLLHSLITYSLP